MDSRTTSRAALVIAWAWAVLVVFTSITVGIVLLFQRRFEPDVLIFVSAAVVYSFLGLLIVIRQPGNRLSWLLLTVAAWVALTGLTEVRPFSNFAAPESPSLWDVLAIVWSNVGYFVGLLLPLLLFFYLFPSGRFLSRGWSWAGWVVGVISPLAITSQMFARRVGPDGADWTVANPIGVFDGFSLEDGILGLIFGVGFVSVGLGAVPAVIVRYRRSNAEVRAQVKWVVFATIVLVGTLVVLTVSEDRLSEWAGSLLFALMLLAVPTGVMVAITRYKLYEIDRIISRTLGYAFVVAFLGFLFVALVTVVTSILPSQNALAVASSTLAVAAVFNPLRRRVQNAVDRRFNRSRYQAQAVSDQFVSELSESLTIDEIAEVWGRTVNDALQPEASTIWIRLDQVDMTGVTTSAP